MDGLQQIYQQTVYVEKNDNAFSCPCGGYPSIRHNEIRDITATLLIEVCHNAGIEPHLQPVAGKQFNYRTANVEDGARLDVAAENFWGMDRQRAFFDIRVFNPLAPSYSTVPLAQCYNRNEQEKCRAYDQRVRQIEHVSFSPLVFSMGGGSHLSLMSPSHLSLISSNIGVANRRTDELPNVLASWIYSL